MFPDVGALGSCTPEEITQRRHSGHLKCTQEQCLVSFGPTRSGGGWPESLGRSRGWRSSTIADATGDWFSTNAEFVAEGNSGTYWTPNHWCFGGDRAKKQHEEGKHARVRENMSEVQRTGLGVLPTQQLKVLNRSRSSSGTWSHYTLSKKKIFISSD